MTTAALLSPSLSRPGLVAELRALLAVTQREWRIMRRYPSMLFSLFIWPIIFPAAYIISARALAGPDGSGLALFTKAVGTSDFIGYIAVGTTVWMWQNVALWTIGLALRDEQMRGTLESNWLSPTWRFSFLLGSGVMQGINLALFLAISGLEFWLFFGVRFNGNPLLILLLFVAAMPAIYGLGFAFASLVIAAKEANAFVFLVRGLVMVFCGITYPVSVLPGWMQSVAAWLPPTYVIHGIRNAALNNADFNLLLPDLVALALFGLGWLAVGYAAFVWMERRARQTGAIGQY
jgi:ABC-2 type transport system permease protein